MEPTEAMVEGAETLTRIFGYWPSFHDAEVIDFNLSRGDLDPEREAWDSPSITARIHVFEMTPEVDPAGFFVLRHHHIVDFRFFDVDCLRLVGFNHQNAIFGLDIERSEEGASRIKVDFTPAFGLESSFECSRVLVQSVTPCTPKGVPCA